jgi:ATP-dependent Clp protease protease subunit
MGAGYSIKAKGNASAEILVYEDVGAGWFGGVTAKDFSADLKALGNVQTIDVRINSGGGDVFDGLAIYRQLVDHRAKVIVHIDGLAASIASVIAMAGDEIRISEAALVMIHDAWGMAVGNADDMRQMASVLETTSGAITDVYVARTRKDRGDIRNWMEAETWFTAAEAVENGFADAVDENLRVAARFDPAKFNYKHTPAALAGLADVSAGPRPLFDTASETIARMKSRFDRRRMEEIRAA